MSYDDGIDVIFEDYLSIDILISLFEQLLRNISVELIDIHILLDYLVEDLIDLVLIKLVAFVIADSVELISDSPIISH